MPRGHAGQGQAFCLVMSPESTTLSYKHRHLISVYLIAHYGLFRVPSSDHSGPGCQFLNFHHQKFWKLHMLQAYLPFHLKIRMILFLPNFPTVENATYGDRQTLSLLQNLEERAWAWGHRPSFQPWLDIKWLPLPFPYYCDRKQVTSPSWVSTFPLGKIREGKKERLYYLWEPLQL